MVRGSVLKEIFTDDLLRELERRKQQELLQKQQTKPINKPIVFNPDED